MADINSILKRWSGLINTNSWVHDGEVERSAVDIVELALLVGVLKDKAQAAADAAQEAVKYIDDVLNYPASEPWVEDKINRKTGWVSVKDYGAAGDGVTDDTQAVRDAISEALSHGGGTLYWPEGSYLTTGDIAGFTSVRHVGFGAVRRGTTAMSLDENGVSDVYASPSGTGDGLSAATPSDMDSIIAMLQRQSPLKGTWTVHMAAGTYEPFTVSNIFTERENGLTITGNAVTKTDPADRTTWVWDTIVDASSASGLTFSIYVKNVNALTLQNLCLTNSSGNGTRGIAGDCSATSYLKVDTVKAQAFKSYGFYILGASFSVVTDCFIDGYIDADTRTSYGIMAYNCRMSFNNTTSNSTVRTLIKNVNIGLGAWGGKSYIHNDNVDYEDCAMRGVDAAYGAHIGSGITCSYTNCVTNAYARDAGSVAAEITTGGTPNGRYVGTFGLLRDKAASETDVLFRQGYYFINPSYEYYAWGLNALKAYAPRFMFNMGTNDPSASAQSALALRGGAAFCNADGVAYLGVSGANGAALCLRDDASGKEGARADYNTFNNQLSFHLLGTGDNPALEKRLVLAQASFRPNYDADDASGLGLNLGFSGYRWKTVYADTGAIDTSDERKKTNITEPEEALLRAWGKVRFKVFQMRSSIAEKGEEAARLHIGVIAQDIQTAFASEGLDAARYGLFCHDVWEDQYEDVEVVDAPEQIKDGEIVAPAVTHVERRLVREAGDIYSVRYDECLALECAYQRWKTDVFDARLKALEAKGE